MIKAIIVIKLKMIINLLSSSLSFPILQAIKRIDFKFLLKFSENSLKTNGKHTQMKLKKK